MISNINLKDKSRWFHTLLLLGWLAIGISLRFTNLEGKSASSIEISTLGFSIGHGFLQVPLDRVISLDTLLTPLRFDGETNLSDVMHHLISESNHPPLYFMLTHLWMKLFLHNGELASLWIGRSLSAILGAVSIGAIFGLGTLAFRSRLVGQIAAALMAVSPYGIYLAQEARHYTLTILWIIASLSCLVVAMRCIHNRTALPIWIGCVWIIVNSLGFATHYFFALALCAEALVVLGFSILGFVHAKTQRREHKRGRVSQLSQSVRTGTNFLLSGSCAPQLLCPSSQNWRLYAVAALSAIAILVWLPVIQASSHNELTEWIQTGYDIDQIWQPIPRLLVWLLTMVFLLPVEGTNIAIAIISVLVILIVLRLCLPAVIRGVKAQMASRSCLSMQVLGGFFIGAIAIFLIIIYALGKDLSQAARYHFVYFPALIVLLAASLAKCWTSITWEEKRGGELPITIRAGLLDILVNKQITRFNPPQLPTTNYQSKIQSLPSNEVNGLKSKIPFTSTRGKKVVVVILLMGLLGSFTVVSNYGYQKSRRSDLLASHIVATSQAPVLIAMTYETHAELRALIGLGIDFKRYSDLHVDSKTSTTSKSPKFILVQRQDGSKSIPTVLTTILSQLRRPFDLCAVNLKVDSKDIEALNCPRETRKTNINGYRYRLYHCR